MNPPWTLAYAVALPLYAFAQSVGTSLMLHGAIDRGELPSLAKKAAMQGARLPAPAVAIVVLLAPEILSLFGASYSHHGATALRLLVLGALPNFAVVLAVHVARVQRRLRRAVVALGTQAVLALGLAAPLLHALSVTGAGIGWLLAQCVAAGAMLPRWKRSVAHAATSHPAVATGPVPADHFAATSGLHTRARGHGQRLRSQRWGASSRSAPTVRRPGGHWRAVGAAQASSEPCRPHG